MIRRIHVGVAIMLHVVAASAVAQVAVRTDTVESRALGRRVRYHVVLPARYDPRRTYPVLWLLHGYGGDDENWLRLTDLTREIARYPLIVVLPAARNSWYVNAARDSTSRYEDFIVRDLYADVRHHFAIDTARQAIAGLSMGGYGAVMLALRHPERFRFAGGLSSALSVPAAIDPVTIRVAGPSVDSAFSCMPAVERAGYDPFVLFRRTPAAKLPFFYLAIGTGDSFTSFLPLGRAFTDSLRAYGARYEYHERPGGHSWSFWGSELPPMLARMWREIERADRRR